MGQFVHARCGFNTEPASFLAYPALRCQTSAYLETDPAEFDASPVTGKVGSATFEAGMCDMDGGPGGFAGALAWTYEPAGPFAFESSADAAEPLGHNLGAFDLLLMLRSDVRALSAALANLSPPGDPGDLTVTFDANL